MWLQRLKGSPYRFLLLSIVIFAIFYVYPIIDTFRLSFYTFPMTNIGNQRFVGFQNFFEVFGSGRLYHTTILTLEWTVTSVVGSMLFGLGIALLLSEEFPGRGLVRTLILAPWIFPELVGASMWKITMNSEYGLLGNIILPAFGFRGSLLSSPETAIFACSIVRIWKLTPFVALMCLAGIQAIEVELYEAASLDGAGSFNKFRHITIPQLSPVLLVALILATVWTANQFDIVYILTRGGPGDATKIAVVDIYSLAFIENSAGIAQAEAVVFVIALIVISALYYRGMRGKQS